MHSTRHVPLQTPHCSLQWKVKTSRLLRNGPLRADDVCPEAIGTQVLAALRQMARELDDGALLIVDTNRSRLRLLPLSTGRGPGSA